MLSFASLSSQTQFANAWESDFDLVLNSVEIIS